MNDERWKSLLSFSQFILGTVVVGIFGTIINSQIQTREVEIKEQEQISKNLTTVLSGNAADKLLMAQFYAAVTRSDEIRKRWEIYRDELKKEIAVAEAERKKAQDMIKANADAKTIDEQQAIIQQIDARIKPGAKPLASEKLPARIYFHIQNNDQRAGAAEVASKLSQDTNIVVPGIQKVDEATSANEIRYFKLADAVEAEELSKQLSKYGVKTVTKYLSGYESPEKLRPRHYELWLSATWKP